MPKFTKQSCIIVAAYTAVFWGFRLVYWNTVAEAPFSDMLGYICVAREILLHFSFGCDEATYAQWTPVTPTFMAVAYLLGRDHFYIVYKVLIQSICFAGTALLAFELALLTGRKWLGVALLFVVALSRPSIFWSLKLSTESLSEALLICSAALVLRCIRVRSIPLALFAGMVCMILALNRPQYFPGAVLVACCLAAFAIFRRDRVRGMQAAVFILGVVVAWSPWLVRNYRHLGGPVLFSTSGYYTVIWEHAAGPVRPGAYTELKLEDGTVLSEFNLEKIDAILHGLPNDYERQVFLRKAAMAWYKANLWDLPPLLVARFQNFISRNGASALTVVSRETLFGQTPLELPVALLNIFLLDKSSVVWILAFGGALLLTVRTGLAGTALLALWLTPWPFLTILIGYERMVEPMISLTVWLAVYFAAEAILWISQRDTRLRPA